MGDPFFSGGGSFMFNFVPIFIGIIFVIVIGMILFTVVKGITEWSKNNQSPRLAVPAQVKSKRTHVSRRMHSNNDHMHSGSRTSYYVTFEFDSGDRSEFSMSGSDYGQLAEGDFGTLTFQGTRYLGFERNVG
ncbi:DUF2500 domain-containing protein [Radiobacillus sp. PE A8.2]|uniref:DUF2500 domain-containing protein n=1 Tax=Radiobacillus sp. PE A8.2 TaxID=3380349 RepID=UPI00388DA646